MTGRSVWSDDAGDSGRISACSLRHEEKRLAEPSGAVVREPQADALPAASGTVSDVSRVHGRGA